MVAVLLFVATSYPLVALPAFFLVRAAARRPMRHRWLRCFIVGLLAAGLLAPALVVAGHQPWLVPFALVWLHGQTGADILLVDTAVALVVFLIGALWVLRADPSIEPAGQRDATVHGER